MRIEHLFKKSKAAFTLVEMLVALSIFSVVMLAMTSAVLTMIDVNKKARATQLVMDNLNFALEDLLRNIRMGSNYSGSFSNLCVLGTFSFTNSEGNDVQIRCSSGSIEKNESDGSGFVPVTAPEITVDLLRMSQVGGNRQNGVFIVIAGEAVISDSFTSDFSLQTFVSQRKLGL